MIPYSQPVLRVHLGLHGYRIALRRFSRALDATQLEDATTALFETLSWAVALDERCGKIWYPHGKPLKQSWYLEIGAASAMPGLRYARNSAHHDWGEVLRVDTSGENYPARWPPRAFEFVWRDRDELADPERDHFGINAYDSLMAGRPADVTLAVLGEAFERVALLLEPEIAGQHVQAPDGTPIPAGPARTDQQAVPATR